jgi:hypothetical protein
MKLPSCLIALLLTCGRLLAADFGNYVEEPNVVGKIAAALASSDADELKPRILDEGGTKTSYHLKSVDYLGALDRGNERFMLAAVFFVRSSPQGRLTPPGRGHAFLLCLSSDFKISGHCRLGSRDVELAGAILKEGDSVIADFSASNEDIRRRGFQVGSGNRLPYPFSDRLTSPDEPAPKHKPRP